MSKKIARRPIFIFAIYTILTLILTHPLIFNLTNAIPSDIGDPLLNTWILAWDSHALLTDPANLFNANIFHPLPNTLAYSEHLFSTALLAMPFQLISGEPLLAYNLSLLLTFPLAAFGMYLLALRWIKQPGAAFIAGLVFAFNPYRFASIGHLQLLTFQWLPFILLAIEKIITQNKKTAGNKPAVLLTLFLLLQILASWYLAIYTALITAIYLLVALISGKIKLAQLYRLTPPFVIALLMTLPFILPYLAVIGDLRRSRPLSLALSLAATPTDFIAAVPFNWLFGSLTAPLRTRPAFTEENLLFIGIIAPLLALLSLFPLIKHRLYFHLALVAIFIISLNLTFPAPYAALVAVIPSFAIIRVPPRWIIPALFALSGLTAFGYAFLLKRLNLNAIPITIITALLIIAETASVPLPLAPVENKANLNPAYNYLSKQPTGFALLELPLYSIPAPEFPEVKRLYASTVGWWLLINGYSGYTPPRQPELARSLAGFPDKQATDTLQKLTDSFPLLLLIHPGEKPFNRSLWEDNTRWQVEHNPIFLPLGQFEGDYLYQIQPVTTFSSTLASFGQNKNIRLIASLQQWSENTRLILYWQADKNPQADYTVFIHLRAEDGFVREQADSPPVSGYYPTTNWQATEIIQDIHSLPSTNSSLFDHFAVGLYEATSGKRLPAFDQNGKQLPDNAFIIPISSKH